MFAEQAKFEQGGRIWAYVGGAKKVPDTTSHVGRARWRSRKYAIYGSMWAETRKEAYH